MNRSADKKKSYRGDRFSFSKLKQQSSSEKSKKSHEKVVVPATTTSSSTTHKEKKRVLRGNEIEKQKVPITHKHYTIRPIIPARKKELISVATAMHRDAFAPRVKKLFQPETKAALSSIENDLYIGWRCPEFTWDCIRLGSDSRCFCDHNLTDHESYKGKTQNLKCIKCPCQAFNFIPQRPEEIGEWWLRKRPNFDVGSWRAKCRCKHNHVEHCSRSRRCKIRGCSCFAFESNFLCAACDRHLEEHATFFDDSNSRRKHGLPYGQYYIPFSELPDLRNICLTGSASNSSPYNAIADGPYGVPIAPKNIFLTSSASNSSPYNAIEDSPYGVPTVPNQIRYPTKFK